MSHLGQHYSIQPPPGSFFGGAPEKADGRRGVPSEGNPQDALVRWCENMESTLKNERQNVTSEMRKAWGYYKGTGFWGRNRAPWRVRTQMNWCFRVPNQWAAILSDNKPKATFSAYKREDQQKAEILTAAWNDAYDRNDWQSIIRGTILMSRIIKKGFLHLTYDPYANNGDGDFVLKSIPGLQVYANKGTTSVDDAETLMYEYEESYGEILQRFPKSERFLRRYVQAQADADDDRGGQQAVPASVYNVPGMDGSPGSTYREGPHLSSESDVQVTDSGGIPVREFWTRPKGPRYQTELTALVFNVGNKPNTRQKLIEFEDGHVEPLQWVITEGNYCYELPYSQVELLKHAEQYGGIKILRVVDAVECYTKKVKVPLYPSGRRVVKVGDFIADDGANPFCDGDWPFIPISAFGNSKEFWGTSDVDLIAELNIYANRLLALFLEAGMLTGNPIWRLPLSSEISDEDLTNAPGAVQREDPQSLKLGRREPGPDMPAYLMQTLGFVIEQIKAISGLADVATGGKMKGQQSTETVSMYQEAAGIGFRDALHDIERAIVRLGNQFKGRVAQFATNPKLVRFKDAQGETQSLTFFGTDITAPMVMEAKAGSMLPTSPSARLNMMMNLAGLQKPAIDVVEIWRSMQEMGLINSATDLEARITREMNDPKQSWKVFGLPAPGGGKQGSQRKHKSVRNKSSSS